MSGLGIVALEVEKLGELAGRAGIFHLLSVQVLVQVLLVARLGALHLHILTLHNLNIRTFNFHKQLVTEEVQPLVSRIIIFSEA